ncbi:hypothetical protein [Vibrio harveyi]
MKFAQLTPLAMLCVVSLSSFGSNEFSSDTSTPQPNPVTSTVSIPAAVSSQFPPK